MAIRSASRANTRSVWPPRAGRGAAGAALLARAVDLHARSATAVKLRAAATSSTSASMSELRNSNDRLQVLQIRWK